MDRKEHYRRMAAECVRLAHDARDPANKAQLLEMAQDWVYLAKLTDSVAPPDPEGQQTP